MSMPGYPTPPLVPPLVVAPPTTASRAQGWVQTASVLMIALSLVCLSIAVVRNPAPAVFTPVKPETSDRPPATPEPPNRPPVAPLPPDRPPAVPPAAPPAAPRTEVARAALAYRDGLGTNFSSLANRVRSGEMKTLDAIGGAFRENGLKLANPLQAMILKHCDESGNVTDAAGLADELRAVSEALGASRLMPEIGGP